MFEVREKPQLVEKALLVGVYYDKSEADEATSLLQELRELVETLNIGIARTTLVKVREAYPSHLMGKVKWLKLLNWPKSYVATALFLIMNCHQTNKGIGKTIPIF